MILKLAYPELPPSSNHIYIKGTILTREAREYAERFSQYCAQNYLHLINEIIRPGPRSIYGIHLRFFFETVINDTYMNPKVPASKQAKTRYKKFDLTNRIKLLEDCVRDAIGVDDCLTFVASQEKHMDPSLPRVEVYVQEVDPSQFGVP
jgi:Holliday junction resolvase RusA-like endonuclease